MTNPPKKSTKQSLPKPRPQTKQIHPKPPRQEPKANKYAPKTLVSRPGLGNLRVIDSDRPEYQP